MKESTKKYRVSVAIKGYVDVLVDVPDTQEDASAFAIDKAVDEVVSYYDYYIEHLDNISIDAAAVGLLGEDMDWFY